ncbi:MAG: hypothetical protein H6767_04170 [Candidatus Peribacteria bacterium]|nr:MAG: hypothetical protein H6767_04170 [Candidatus Peribacteria bacterium]
MFRSEHTQDREGVSDIGRSSLYRELPSQERYADMLQNPYTYFQDYAHVSAYAKHYNIPVTKVKAGFGFSVWEYIEGQNITIAEDSSHRGRYHVMLQGE